jgi:gliding motility-associated-like protein
MKVLFLLLATNMFILSLLGQQTFPKAASYPVSQTLQEAARINRLQFAHPFPPGRPGERGIRIGASTFEHPRMLAGFIRQQTGLSGKPAKTAAKTSGKTEAKMGARPQIANANCTNHSFFQLTGLKNSVVYVGAMTHTQDDGAVISGAIYDSTVIHAGWQLNAFLFKCDKFGNILWVSLLIDQNNDPSYYFNPIRIKEMQNGDLMLASFVSTAPNGGTQPVTTIYRLTAGGAILWHSELKSTLLQSPNNEWTYFDVKDINPGLNGDYILSGTTIAVTYGAQGETVVRMDAAGNRIWDMNLTNRTGDYNRGAEGMTAYLSGNNIVAVGINHGSSFQIVAATFFTTLDYATGNVQSKRFWMNNDPDNFVAFDKSPVYYNNYAIQQSNGHCLVYAVLFSATTMSTDTVDYFGVQEYDATGNFIHAYTLSSLFHSSYYNNSIYFDTNDNGYVSIPTDAGNNSENDYFASIRNDQIIRQRVQTYGKGIQSGYAAQTCFMNDGAYMVSDEYYDPSSGSWLSIKKMYDTDTASACLGRDTAFLMKLPLSMVEDPGYNYLDPPVSGQIVPVSYGIAPAPISYRNSFPCMVNSYCSLVQIQGQTGACGVPQPMVYTASRNGGCGSMPQWNIDTSAVSSITQVNDTTISILFKNVNWHGKLYASLPPGVCSMGVGDSVSLNIISTPQPPVLVADTILCAGNTIVLHAGTIFSTYLWQNGSTDSNYSVTSAGLYSVAVTDACGDHYRASSQVINANFPFSPGLPIKKCNNDSVILHVTGGFFNYQWSAAGFNASGIADSVVKVDPLQDIIYYVTAEKWAGCSVTASVQVNALHSPPIGLGNDTSFCTGGYKLLDAGPGFVSYQWNTGQLSEQITVSQAGLYSVEATAANGCVSSDSLLVTAVYPSPQFSLGSSSDTTTCSNQPIVYHFPANGDQYLWSDGVSGASRVIVSAGTYGLNVVNSYGCSTNHSITVSVNAAPVLDLGPDTTLCKNTDLVLDASRHITDGRYRWQDGSSGSEYTVTTGGIYSVSATAPNGCVSGDSIAIVYIDIPHFSLGQDTMICNGQSFILQPALSYAGTYLWQDGSTNESLTVKDTGSYILTASNICGSYTGARHVAPGLCRLLMPSAFTPNGDGHNDLFRLKYPFTVNRFVMIIYDRWGQEVYRSDNVNQGWDGTIHGSSPAQAGTYVWYISLTDLEHKSQSQNGTVILIR